MKKFMRNYIREIYRDFIVAVIAISPFQIIFMIVEIDIWWILPTSFISAFLIVLWVGFIQFLLSESKKQ